MADSTTDPVDTGDLVGTSGDPAEIDPILDDITDPSHDDYVDAAADATPVEDLTDFEEA